MKEKNKFDEIHMLYHKIIIIIIVYFFNIESYARNENTCKLLERIVESVEMEGNLLDVTKEVARAYDVPVCVELDDSYCAYNKYNTEKTCDNYIMLDVSWKNMKLRNILDSLISKTENNYAWSVWNCKVINIYPKRYVADEEYLYNTKIPSYNFIGASSDDIISVLREFLKDKIFDFDGGYRPFSVSIKPGASAKTNISADKKRSQSGDLGKSENKHTFNFSGGTLREILNEIVVRMGGEWYWYVRNEYIIKYRDGMVHKRYLELFDNMRFRKIDKTKLGAKYGNFFRIPSCDIEKKGLGDGFDKFHCDKFHKRIIISIEREYIEYIAMHLSGLFGVSINLEIARQRCYNSPYNC